MNKEIIFLMTILSLALITEFVLAQPLQGQWPPLNGNDSVSNNNNNFSSQHRYPSQQTGSYGSGWQNNYVSPNYNPYVNQSQMNYRLTQQQPYQFSPGATPPIMASPYARTINNYYPMATSPLFPVYGNPMLMPPSMMTYNPWLPAYGATPLMTLPILGY